MEDSSGGLFRGFRRSYNGPAIFTSDPHA